MDAKHTLGEPRVLISRTALLHNAAVLRRRLSPGVRLCAIVKADAYGHGAGIVADTLCNCALESAGAAHRPAADALAVASLDEASALRGRQRGGARHRLPPAGKRLRRAAAGEDRRGDPAAGGC